VGTGRLRSAKKTMTLARQDGTHHMGACEKKRPSQKLETGKTGGGHLKVGTDSLNTDSEFIRKFKWT